VIPQKGKTRITIFLDNDVLEEFRSRAEIAGHGYQTMINDALREYLDTGQKPLMESTLRRIIQEELSASHIR
jgi:metal-responsive CopG/Arc/MetJ family transcriptional regulator